MEDFRQARAAPVQGQERHQAVIEDSKRVQKVAVCPERVQSAPQSGCQALECRVPGREWAEDRPEPPCPRYGLRTAGRPSGASGFI